MVKLLTQKLGVHPDLMLLLFKSTLCQQRPLLLSSISVPRPLLLLCGVSSSPTWLLGNTCVNLSCLGGEEVQLPQGSTAVRSVAVPREVVTQNDKVQGCCCPDTLLVNDPFSYVALQMAAKWKSNSGGGTYADPWGAKSPRFWSLSSRKHLLTRAWSAISPRSRFLPAHVCPWLLGWDWSFRVF